MLIFKKIKLKFNNIMTIYKQFKRFNNKDKHICLRPNLLTNNYKLNIKIEFNYLISIYYIIKI